MTPVLAPSSLRAVRDHFDRGGSPFVLFYAGIAIVVLIGFLVLANRFQQRRLARTPTDDPKKLLTSVVRKLGLSVVQRDLLRRIISDLQLEHPTVLLLSPILFVEHAMRWTAARNDKPGGTSRVLSEPLENLGRALFGSEMPGKEVHAPSVAKAG